MLVTMVSGSGIDRVEIPDEKVISFPRGIPGFEEACRFALFEAAKPFYLLQSVEDPELGFVLVAPQAVWPAYKAEIPKSSVEQLQLEQGESVQLLSIVSLPAEGNQGSVNLRAPLAFSPSKPLAIQVILPDSPYPVRHLLSFTSEGELEVSFLPDGSVDSSKQSGTASGTGA